MDRWSVAHAHNRLSKAGLITPLVSDSGEPYILRVGKDMEPVYWLSSDNSYMTPGLAFWQRLRDAVDQADLASL